MRDKLIELLDWNFGYTPEIKAEELADYLIGNGVTIRPKGEWENTSIVIRDPDGDWVAEMFRCPLCGRKEYKREPFCHCGADMRGNADATP